MFKRVLIANRGEIAIRIARAAAALGIESVAVLRAGRRAVAAHQARDRGARRSATRAATRCAPISTSRRSSPRPQASGCDCVHPGYGFLSENAALRRALRRPRA